MKFHQHNKKQNNFFTKMIQRYGEDFLQKINAKEMQNGAISLFRDIAKGRVSIEDHGHYFLDNQFIDNCLIEANIKLKLHSMNYIATNWFVTNNPHFPDMQQALQTLEYNTRSAQAYETIVSGLNAVKFTRDLNYLYAMANNLRNLRNNI